MSVSVVLTIHNQETIISDIVSHLFKNSSKNVKEYIFVLDGCTDNSEAILRDVILNNFPYESTYKILFTPNVYETRANNVGLKEVKGDYAIIVQDDMRIIELNWDVRLVFPMKKYDDVWAVTARTSLNLTLNGHFIDCAEGPVGHRSEEPSDFPRNEFRIRSLINRGPLAMDMNKLREIGFFDETLPGVQSYDDVDLCYKILESRNWKCGSYWIKYYSPLSWGKTRVGENVNFLRRQEILNAEYVINKYRDIIEPNRIIETRIIEEQEYCLDRNADTIENDQ
jgi:glycosyltransferase involved in cell wall biosynthesis